MAEKVADKAMAKTAAKAGAKPVPKEPAKKRVGLVEFFRQVRIEVKHVTWPSRKETMVTTAMVFVMVIAAAGFFLTVDWVLSHLVQFVITGGI
jgi:preprotein translocase subunit SecE